MTARRYRSDPKLPRTRELTHRRSRAAFDDPGADQLDEWMAACPAAEAAKSAS
jgi:hypothetical protein